MSDDGCIVVVGGTDGIGKELARYYAGTGRETVLTGRDAARAEAVAAEIGGSARGIALDLAKPKTIRDALSSVGPVRYLAIVAIQRDDNTIRDFDIDRALELVTLKLVGFAEVVHVLLDRLSPDSSIVLFGGQAKDRPYPGSTTVSTVNGGISGLAGRSPGSWRRSGSTPSIPGSPATARSGTASRRRSSKATSRRPSPRSSRRWTTSSTGRGSCSRTRPSRGSTSSSTTDG